MDIYVINLKERIDRLEYIKKTFKSFKNININIIDAIKHEKGSIGCFLSHKKCINIAKEKKMKYIIVMEDDCAPSDNFEIRLINIINYLEKNDDWDIFLGGITGHIKNKIIKNVSIDDQTTLVYLAKGKTTHFIVYNMKCYDFFLNCDENNLPIDLCWHNNLIAVVSYPFLAKQLTAFSTIENKTINYNLSFIKSENQIKEILSSNIINNYD